MDLMEQLSTLGLTSGMNCCSMKAISSWTTHGSHGTALQNLFHEGSPLKNVCLALYKAISRKVFHEGTFFMEQVSWLCQALNGLLFHEFHEGIKHKGETAMSEVMEQGQERPEFVPSWAINVRPLGGGVWIWEFSSGAQVSIGTRLGVVLLDTTVFASLLDELIRNEERYQAAIQRELSNRASYFQMISSEME